MTPLGFHQPTFGQSNRGPVGVHRGQNPLIANLRLGNQTYLTANVGCSSCSTHVASLNQVF